MQPSPLQLHDIHLPIAAGWWPPAIGWWLLAIMLLSLCIWLGLSLWKWYCYYSWRTKLLNEFNNKISRPKQVSSFQVTIIAEALRQAALTLFPEKPVASLTGQDWLEFLDEHANHPVFSRAPGSLLVDLPYSDAEFSDIDSLSQLEHMAKNWVACNASRKRYEQNQQDRKNQ